MTPQRQRELEESYKAALTYDEMAEGWHFCPYSGHKLVGPDDPDLDAWEACECFPDESELADLL